MSSTPSPSSSSSSDAALLSQCLASIVANDADYALCLMNSGMFDIDSTSRAASWLSQSSVAVIVAQLVGAGKLPSVSSAGTCRLLCTAPTMTASDSCCAAASALRNCEPSAAAASSIAYCQQVIHESFALQSQCGLSNATITLIAVCATVAFIVALLMGLSRLHARRQQRSALNDSNNMIESRFAVATLSRSRAVLAAWRQVTNLVWKNVVIRRRRPVAFVIEQFLPVLLVTGLVFIANLDAIFGEDPSSSSSQANAMASNKTAAIFCTGLSALKERDIGAPSDAMTTFYSSGQTVIGMFLLISYIKFVSTTATSMVLEKETRVREVMKIMGLTDATLLMSWLVTTAVLATPLAFAIAAELKYGRVFAGAEFATLVLLFWALSLSIVAFSYCVAPFFDKSRTAALASALLWLVLFFPFFHVQPRPNATKYWAALAPPTAFALAVDDLLRHAQLGTGVAYALAAVESPVTVPSARAMSGMLLLDAALLCALGWYLDQVLPQQYGVRRRWNFVFTRAYWQQRMNQSDNTVDDSVDDIAADATLSFVVTSPRDGASSASPQSQSAYVASSTLSPLAMSYSSRSTTTTTNIGQLQHQVSSDGSVVFMKEPTTTTSAVERTSSSEPVSKALALQEVHGTCLQIRGLRKVFAGDHADDAKVAVHSLDLTLYAGHITALLGHNGAGKTTTIAMLTGLLEPTAGDATLYGRSLTRDFAELRQIMGICPQHDVLLPELTVEEHIVLFGTIKHVAPKALAAEVDTLLRDVGLTAKRHTRAKDLSGGQKRKLSVALAFVGDSKLVFLDEPTSGMDPYSRRFTWNLLQRKREDRVIVLTTHFMDEADILGDRIAILADGALCCVGSSLFLKTRYGAGYNLTVIKASQHCDVDALTRFLQQYVPAATCISDVGAEAVFQLPAASASVFGVMLEAFDANVRRLGVAQYGISVTTLEDVFLRIARDRDDRVNGCADDSCSVDDIDAVDPQRKTSATSAASRPTLTIPAATAPGTRNMSIASTATAPPGFWTQYGALVTKRVRITKRDRKSILNAVVVPLLFLLLLVLLPEIDVANFLPDNYTSSLADAAEQANCTTANFTRVAFSASQQQNCLTNRFDYCDLGLIDCDATACCNKFDVVSPYYACNTCDRRASQPLQPQTPCYNSKCLDRDGAQLQVTLNGFLVAVVVMLAFAFVPAAIVAFAVREKSPTQDAKSLQLICGANVSAYWLANWTHDIAMIAVSVAAAAILIPLSNRALAGSEEAFGVAALVATHALAVVPLAYLFSFRFDKHAVAQTSLLVFALSSGGLLSIFSFLCRILNFELAGSLTLSELDRNYLRWLFLLFPGYALNNGIYEIASRKLSRDALFGTTARVAPASFFGLFEGLGRDDPSCIACWTNNSAGCCNRNVLDVDVAGAPIAYCVVEAVVFTLLVFALENRRAKWRTQSVSTKRRNNNHLDEDDDVHRERQRVETTAPSPHDQIFIRNLRQQYGRDGKVALDDLCLAIPKGECFGYLGINGAGKSTTMKVLTGQLAPTSGFVSLGGFDLATARDRARRVIGYCPQFDALHDLLTVREQLELYARLKGVARTAVASAVAEKIGEVGLTEYADRLTRGLSGGNKRKVSTAIALMGAPPIVFLDEPTTGVDPSARRKMWDVIAAVCATRATSVVLTTHSMEECEALCARVGILVSGALQCLGSVAHLKHKFGRGFTVDVTVCEPEAADVAVLCGAIDRIVRRTANSRTIANSDADTVDSVARDCVLDVCAMLGAATRGQRILRGDGSSWALKSYLDTAGSIPLDVLSAWWLAEDRSDALESFFQTEFTDSECVERQGEHFRFQVPKHALLRPHVVFHRLETHRARLFVSEYGVSETSLEHIFNNMAAQQDDELLVVNGGYAAGGSSGSRQELLRPSSRQSIRSYDRANSLRGSFTA